MERRWMIIGGMILGLIVIAVVGRSRTIPKSVFAVERFDASRYMGKWYEIARLDFKFERNLNNTSAEYTLNEDGTISVLNRGYNYKSRKWRQARGRAKFVASSDEAKLQVSFFGPLYSGYNVIAIDPLYKYALVAGRNRRFLWLLSREKTMPERIRQAYVSKAEQLGFRTSELVWVQQDPEPVAAIAL